MTNRPKQIVLDKDAFIGINLGVLCDFAKHHFLIAPGVLLYECVTSEACEKKRLLERYERLIKEGACCCPRGAEFVQWEAEQCRPYPLFLATAERMTERICRGDVQLHEILKPTDAHEWERLCTRDACAKYIELSEAAERKVAQNCPNVREEIKGFPPDQCARLQYILDLIATRFDIHEMAMRSVSPDWIKAKDQFCLSDEWMTWQRIRLTLAIVWEYSYKNLRSLIRNDGYVPKRVDAEHDDQDVDYVLLLSRADAIITRDKKLVQPLARAAFPEKDVFSSLEEVPESYRCDWAGE